MYKKLADYHVTFRRQEDGSESLRYEDNPVGIVDFSQPLPAGDRWYYLVWPRASPPTPNHTLSTLSFCDATDFDYTLL